MTYILGGWQSDFARNWARAYPESVLQKRNLQKHEWQHSNTAGLQGFVMNTRRKPLDDIRVRRALVLSFDYESINNRLFYGLYKRSYSLFTNGSMAAEGKPQGAELALLNSVRNKLPAAVFDEPCRCRRKPTPRSACAPTWCRRARSCNRPATATGAACW